jgi:hypothetical protein
VSRTFHLCISVRGMLNWDRRETLRNMRSITKSDGTRYATVEEFRNALMDELLAGNEVLPLAKECDKFDPKHGCLGHEEKSCIGPSRQEEGAQDDRAVVNG